VVNLVGGGLEGGGFGVGIFPGPAGAEYWKWETVEKSANGKSEKRGKGWGRSLRGRSWWGGTCKSGGERTTGSIGLVVLDGGKFLWLGEVTCLGKTKCSISST